MTGETNAASVAIFSGPEVLLVARARSPYCGLWTLPGGRIELGESAEAAARREIVEELGLELGDLVPSGAFDMGRQFRLAVFAAKIAAGVPSPNDEIANWQWRHPDELAGLKTTPGLERILALAHTALTGL